MFPYTMPVIVTEVPGSQLAYELQEMSKPFLTPIDLLALLSHGSEFRCLTVHARKERALFRLKMLYLFSVSVHLLQCHNKINTTLHIACISLLNSTISKGNHEEISMGLVLQEKCSSIKLNFQV